MSIFVTKSAAPHPHYCVGLTTCRFAVCAFAFAAFLCSAAPVSASCGHYLFRNGIPVAQQSSSLSYESFSEIQEEPAGQVPRSVPSRRCHGPNCSANPSSIPGATSNLVRELDQQAILDLFTHTPLIRDPVQIPESEHGNVFVPSSIFRPPDA